MVVGTGLDTIAILQQEWAAMENERFTVIDGDGNKFSVYFTVPQEPNKSLETLTISN